MIPSIAGALGKVPRNAQVDKNNQKSSVDLRRLAVTQ